VQSGQRGMGSGLVTPFGNYTILVPGLRLTTVTVTSRNALYLAICGKASGAGVTGRMLAEPRVAQATA
jgi:hypothetical protein